MGEPSESPSEGGSAPCVHEPAVTSIRGLSTPNSDHRAPIMSQSLKTVLTDCCSAVILS